jgi:hypothetical protein
MIAMQNIIDKDKSLLTIMFDRSVLNNLKCKCNDYLMVLQSNFKHNLFTIVKSDNGYRIRRFPSIKKTYQVNIYYPFEMIGEFDLKECTYFLKKNNSIKILLN